MDEFLYTVYLASCGALGQTPEKHMDVDWRIVYGIATEQRVLPLVYVALLKDRSDCPDTVFADMERDCLGAMLKNDMKREEAAELVKGLYSSGIKAAILKGCSIAECYDDPNTRHSNDLDLIAAPEDARKAFKYLSETMPCFERWKGNGHYGVLIHPVFGAVELHDMFAARKDNMIWFSEAKLLYDPIDFVDCGDHYEISPTRQFSFLCYHAFKHLVSGNISLQMCIDLIVYYRTHKNEIDMDSVVIELNRINGSKFIGAILGIFKAVGIDPDIPIAIADRDTTNLLINDIYIGKGDKTVEGSDLEVRYHCDDLKTRSSEKAVIYPLRKLVHYAKAFQCYLFPYPKTVRALYADKFYPVAYAKFVKDRLHARIERSALPYDSKEEQRRTALLKQLDLL